MVDESQETRENESPRLSPPVDQGEMVIAPPGWLAMTDYHFMLVIERLITKRPAPPTPPSWEPIAVPSGIALTVLFTLLTADFKKALGFTGETWTGFALLGLLAAIVWTGFLAIRFKQARARYIEARKSYREPVTEEVVEQVRDQIDRDLTRYTAFRRQIAPPTVQQPAALQDGRMLDGGAVTDLGSSHEPQVAE